MDEQIFRDFMKELTKDPVEMRLIELLIEGQEHDVTLAELVKLMKNKAKR